MEMTVAEMLKLPLFKDMRVVAGKAGLEKREISSVTVIDAMDSTPWIRGKEFVISSGYIFKDDPLALSRFLEDFARSGISALGIKVDRFLGSFPDEVIRKADEFEIPLIHIPNHYAFRDVINPILSNIINRQAERLKFSETVNRSFSELITNGGGVEDVLAHLKRFLKCDVAFMDVVFGENRICSDDDNFSKELELDVLRDLLSRIPNESIKIADKLYGYLFINTDTFNLENESWEIPITHAKTALLLCIQKRIAQTEAEKRYREDFVQDILFRNLRHEKEVWNRAKIFKWNLAGPHRVVIFDIDNYKHHFEDTGIDKAAPMLERVKQRIYSIAVTMMYGCFKEIPYASMSDYVCFIIPSSKDADDRDPELENLRSLLKSIQHEILKKTHFTVTVGVGDKKENIFNFYESYKEARKALEMTRNACGPGHLVFWNELGVYKLLGNIFQTKDAQSFCKEYIGCLIDYDEKKEGSMIKTLEVLARNNWDMKNSARELSIHYNTLRYRIRRISDMTGFDIGSSERRLAFSLALKIYQMSKL